MAKEKKRWLDQSGLQRFYQKILTQIRSEITTTTQDLNSNTSSIPYTTYQVLEEDE